MTAVLADLTIRTLTGPDEVDLFNRFPYVFNQEIVDDLGSGRRRLPWLWLALDRAGEPLARLGWWARPEDDAPLLFDVFDYRDGQEEAALLLLRTAFAAVVPEGATPPKYTRMIPADWHDDPSARAVVEGRRALLEQTGAGFFVERLRLDWTPGTAVPPPPDRGLTFRPVADEAELVQLMTQVLEGTLDAHSREDLARMTPRQTAQLQFDDEMAHYTTPRDWWRVAVLPDGEPVGFVIAARNSYRPVIAYIGVVPRHRGKGFIDPILAEGTRILAATDPERIRAATDLGNVPMARAFERAGYRVFERELLLAWD
ncbi:N-acetyltransferase family protein [Streptacidiphilus sp. N1-3]|uniref:N-acetyltransferase family protein n=1 Tax=Streptacidiphilus alkalitolerans TaxID=3342712 RepID=A0ABV6X2C0_9ACTN